MFQSDRGAPFASKPAPTLDRVHNTHPMWERACSRRGHHGTAEVIQDCLYPRTSSTPRLANWSARSLP
ncbi:hypothetical protein CXF97_14195 [Pseudomonas sp. Choline-02u-1]|nr:hypothetical protein CXF97_14195 [Pseudomonas sp. Choline-02u-1]